MQYVNNYIILCNLCTQGCLFTSAQADESIRKNKINLVINFPTKLHSSVRRVTRRYLAGHVLGETARHDNDVVGNVSHQLDAQVNHSTQGRLSVTIVDICIYYLVTHSRCAFNFTRCNTL